MKNKIKIAVSACLLGHNVRYDQTNKYLKLITEIKEVELIPICPEVTAGFGVPRESIHLEVKSDQKTLITNDTLKDLTVPFKEKNLKLIKLLQTKQVQGYILKSKSPSCAIGTAKIKPSNQKADGLFASLLKSHVDDLVIIDDLEIQDRQKCETFIRNCQTQGVQRLKGEKIPQY